jgi:hypothetical protein
MHAGARFGRTLREGVLEAQKKAPGADGSRGAKESAYNRERLDGDGFLLPPLSVLSGIHQVDKGVRSASMPTGSLCGPQIRAFARSGADSSWQMSINNTDVDKRSKKLRASNFTGSCS